MTANIEADIDQLYKLPLTEFTSARNALAKDLAGDARKKVKAVGKPSVPAWAVNQLYWQDRSTYEALVKAAEQLRTAHRAVISGRNADLRKPAEAHRAAVQTAVDKVRAILKQASLSETSATLNAITRTLEALPTSGRPGRLETPLQPAGFDILAGVKPRADLRLVEKEVPERTPPPDRGPSARELANAKAAVRAARQALEKAQRALKTASGRAEAARAEEARHRAALDRAIQARHAREREIAELRAAVNNAVENAAAAERALADLK